MGQAAQQEELQMSLEEKEGAVSAGKNKEAELVMDMKEGDKDEHRDEKALAVSKAKITQKKLALKEAEDQLASASMAEEKLEREPMGSDTKADKALDQANQKLSKEKSSLEVKKSAIKERNNELATLESQVGQARGEVERLGEAHSDVIHTKQELRSQIQDLERKEADFREGKLSDGKAVAQAMQSQQTLKSHEQHAEQSRMKSEAVLSHEISTTQQQLTKAQNTLNQADKKAAALKAQVAAAKEERRSSIF